MLKTYKEIKIPGFITHYKAETPESLGNSILLMKEDGKAFAILCWYNDEDIVYLDYLSVDPKIRNQRIGTLLQEIRENIGRELGATTAYLKVKKDSWIHEWYIRRGYVDGDPIECDPSFIWMKKQLI